MSSRGPDRPTHRPPRGDRRARGDPRRRGVPRASTARSARPSASCSSPSTSSPPPRSSRWATARGPGAIYGAIFGGFLGRLAVLTIVVLALEPVSFIDIPVLVLTIAVTHIALLFWETRYVSLTLAAPGPQARCRRAHPGRGVARQRVRSLRVPADRRALPLEGHRLQGHPVRDQQDVALGPDLVGADPASSSSAPRAR